MLYNIDINAQVESKLSEKELRSRLVIALYDVENQYSKFDGVDDDLEVIDYDRTDAKEICPHCENELVSRMFDVDGINLIEHSVCEECGYGTPALV
ncbi:MAG: hypothetical protein KAI71_02340 [Candidatus Pacebacteria bacterium]|nr:hypothetical protein [Candidatus Paceibacterota bacterium]